MPRATETRRQDSITWVRSVAFSKKLENHATAVALHYKHYNFARIHKTLRATPAMAAGVSDHIWSIGEIGNVLEIAEDLQHAA